MAEHDPFEPHMPEVDVRADLPRVFAEARQKISTAGAKEGLEANQRCLGILTPGRLVMIVPAPKPGSVPPQFVAQVKILLPSGQPLKILAVSFTALEPLMQDRAKCIPMLGQLLGFAYTGHNVLVFEGHPSALEQALAGTDLLWIDSAMLPFLQKDWIDAAYRVLGPRPLILVCDRKTGRTHPVVKSNDLQGWRYSEPDGEASYVNCLLTTLAKNPPAPVQVIAGGPAPNLAALTRDPRQLEWIDGLPFRYEALDAIKIIGILQRVSKLPPPSSGKSSGQLQAQLATEGGRREKVSFDLTLSEDIAGTHCLDIQRRVAHAL